MKGDDRLTCLAELAVKGDEECFIAICDVMKMPLFRTAKGILGNDSLALDAVSESVYRAYKGIPRLREPKYVATWFTRILINAANDLYKKKKHEIALDTVKESIYEDDYERLDFDQMIRFLPSELREIISLKYYSEFTLEEIANILKIPAGTVKSRLNRALKQLRVEVRV